MRGVYAAVECVEGAHGACDGADTEGFVDGEDEGAESNVGGVGEASGVYGFDETGVDCGVEDEA